MNRIAVASLGNPLRRDDGITEVACRMMEERNRFKADYYYGDPLNYLGRLVSYDLVFLVDAVLSEDPPGRVKLLDIDSVSGPGLSTHSASLDLVRRMLSGKKVFLIGVTVRDTGYGTGLSPGVDPQRIAEEIERIILARASVRH